MKDKTPAPFGEKQTKRAFLSVFAASLFPEFAFIEGTQDFPWLHLNDLAAVIDVFVLIDAVVADDGFSRLFPVLEILDAF